MRRSTYELKERRDQLERYFDVHSKYDYDEDEQQFILGQIDMIDWLLEEGKYKPLANFVFNEVPTVICTNGCAKTFQAVMLKEEPDPSARYIDEFDLSTMKLLTSNEVEVNIDGFTIQALGDLILSMPEDKISKSKELLGRFIVIYDPDTRIPYRCLDYGCDINRSSFGSFTIDLSEPLLCIHE